jgi:hypothetical protein
MVCRNLARRVMSVTWPAFLTAGIAETVFFSLFDPLELQVFGAPLDVSREAFYTLGFLGFWGLGIASSSLTVLLWRPASEVDRCPLGAPTLPGGYSKRDDVDVRVGDDAASLS